MSLPTPTEPPETPDEELPPPPPPKDWSAEVHALAERLRPVRDARTAEREQRERERQARIVERVRAANRERALAMIPERYATALPDHPAVAAWVREVLAGARHGLILNGPVGVGKTWQGFGAYRAVVEGRGCSAVAVSVPALLDGLRPGRTPVVEAGEVERAQLVLLDDLAAERDTDWTSETLYRLIDARWSRDLPTIVTCNAPGASLRERLGDRIASRLNGMGRYVSWPSDAPDLRRRPQVDGDSPPR